MCCCSNCAHFKALFRKNFITWRRTMCTSIVELICPCVLMLILVMARFLVSPTDVAKSSQITQSDLFMSIPTYQLITSKPTSPPDATQVQGLQFMNFSSVEASSLARKSAYMKLIHSPCLADKTRNIGPRTVIAYVDDGSTITTQTVAELKQVYTQQKTMAAGVTMPTGQLLSSFIQDYTFKPFPSSETLTKYIQDKEYMVDPARPGVCYGFHFKKNTDSDYEAKLYFSDFGRQGFKASIPSTLKPAYDPFVANQDPTNKNLYTSSGYSFLQNWFANKVLQSATGNSKASLMLSMFPMTNPAYVSDDFSRIINQMLPFFMLLIYILPVYRLLSNLVSEKESRARESMKMMGLADSHYWLSWLAYYMILVTIISGLCTLILAFNVVKYSNKGFLFLYFWCYGFSLFGLCVFLQSFFSRARVAAIAGTLIYFGTSFINQAVRDESVSAGAKQLASLLTTVAVSLGAQNLGSFETSGLGLTSANVNTVYQNYRFGACIVLMIVSFFIFLWIGIYLDNVLPSAYGLRKPFYFCFTSSYWFGRSSSPQASTRIQIHNREQSKEDVEQTFEMEALFEQKNMKKENFEPPGRELLKLELDKKILKIQDLQKKFSNGFHAVKGLNIKMYNGQIFALLGHNGAGKTTTISMLTGLLTSTSGHAEVFGMDLFNEMNKVRQFLGVCPQHDILFDLLTPTEHLDIFCDFKGVDKAAKKAEIEQMLKDVDLYSSRNIMAKNLSGGNRRKLSVAIALIGGSKLILLDEPTAGMDLTARRKLWNMLKNYKNNRIIILTTHYMDEADILGDRIGIMTGGQLICLGSSLFLKNRFGVGYNLTMVKKNKEPNSKVGQYLASNLGEVKMLSEVSSEITFQIPTSLSAKFKNFFTAFDQALDQLEIRSYGISVTTLEEVFLRVGHGDDSNDDQKLKESLKNHAIKEIEDVSGTNDYSIAEKQETGVCNVFFDHLGALIKKRLQQYRSNYKGVVVELLVPVLLVLIGLGFSKVQFFFTSPQRTLDTSLLPYKQRMIVNSNLVRSSPPNDISPKDIIEALPNFNSAFDVTYKDYSQISTVRGEQAILEAFDLDVFNARNQEPLEPYRYGSYFIYEANRATHQYKVASFVNLTSQDVTALYPQFIYEAILKKATNNPDFKFKVTTSPFPVTQKQRDQAASTSGIFIVFVVSIGFALIPAAVISFILNEREKNLKHMQMITGMSLPAYWVANYFFDIVKSIIPSAIVIGLIYAFDLKFDNVWILFLLYPIGVIPFTYVTSFIFSSENVAQTVTIFMHFVFAGIGGIVVFILRIIPSTTEVGDILLWVFKIIPSFCLTNSIMFASSKDSLKNVRSDVSNETFDLPNMGGDILLLCCHFVFWTIVLIIIEAGSCSSCKRCPDKLKKNRLPYNQDLHLDKDVIEEEERVANARPEDMKVRVHGFRKVYSTIRGKPLLAVEKTSFGLDYGECFALLGVNGAGKTTTFKSLTSDIIPTEGNISINGYDIIRDFSQIRKLIGYCPQHDCIFELMTVEQHLEYYARLKGIIKSMRPTLIENAIQQMNLQEHRKKAAGSLSGGNKRKLSVAIAVLGNPPIILLDEPSAGMDPEARRFMWTVVAKISSQRKQSAVILTTHSMEEAEALSTKMGIMVKGGIFRCFGSSQHIKDRYGTGYEIEVKVSKLSTDEAKEMAVKFGLNQGPELIPFDTCVKIMQDHQVDNFLIQEMREGGLGGDIYKEALQQNGMVSYQNFLTWLNVEIHGLRIIHFLVEDFQQLEVLEHYNDYFKMRVPRKEKTIGYVFGLIETQKVDFGIAEYSVSQTTLEQIFQTFANLEIDKDEKLTFHMMNGKVQVKDKDLIKVESVNTLEKPTKK